MPIYEYRCQDCGKVSSILFRSFNQVSTLSCPSCGSANMARKVSRVVHLKGQRQRLQDMDVNRMLEGAGGPDKKRQAEWARRVSQELGDEIGAEYRDMAEKVEAGEEAFDLYDPSTHLEHRMRGAAEEDGGAASNDGGGMGDDFLD